MNKLALIVVDIQNALTETDSPRFEQFKNNTLKWLEVFRQNHLPIVFFRHTESSGEFELNSDSWQLAPFLNVERDELVLNKYYNSAFKETELKSILDKENITTLVIIGMQTEYCMDFTIKSAFEQDYELLIPSDCHHTFNTALIHADTLIKHYNALWGNTVGRLAETKELITLLVGETHV